MSPYLEFSTKRGICTVGGCCGNMKLNNKTTGGILILSNIIMIYGIIHRN